MTDTDELTDQELQEIGLMKRDHVNKMLDGIQSGLQKFVNEKKAEAKQYNPDESLEQNSHRFFESGEQFSPKGKTRATDPSAELPKADSYASQRSEPTDLKKDLNKFFDEKESEK